MESEARYSIKKYILTGVVSLTVGFIIGVLVIILLGFGFQGTIIVIFISFPGLLFIALYGFYKGLVRHYDFKGDENLFWGGKF